MSNDLTTFGGDIPFSQAAIAKPAASQDRDYAARLQLVSKGKMVDKGLARPGSFAVVDGENVTDLGNSVDCIPLACLDKALDVSGEEVSVAFGKDNPEYQRIAAEALKPDSGCMFGPVYLLFERTTGSFLELFFNNKSGRVVADRLGALLPISKAAAEAHGVDARAPQAANVSSKYIEKGRYAWYAPEIAKAEGVSFDNPPSAEALTKAVVNFLKQGEFEAESRDR